LVEEACAAVKKTQNGATIIYEKKVTKWSLHFPNNSKNNGGNQREGVEKLMTGPVVGIMNFGVMGEGVQLFKGCMCKGNVRVTGM